MAKVFAAATVAHVAMRSSAYRASHEDFGVATDYSATCPDGKSPHQDYPDMACVVSSQKNVALTCPQTVTSTTSVFEAPHTVMTENCPSAVLTTQCMTGAVYTSIIGEVTHALSGLDDTCTASHCPKADWAGCVLRMAGHDFMDYNSATGTGGADGCTDMNHPDNKGLRPCLHDGEHGVSLKTSYEKFCSTVSLADFLVISAEAVMTALGGPDFKDHFKFGRTTGTACTDAAHLLPNPADGCSAVKTTFLDNMHLDWRGAAALMGVHTLGRARPENSGYSGWWSDPENSRKFNNDYFISLRNKGWSPNKAVCGNPEKNQWVMTGSPEINSKDVVFGDSTEMMLDTDMCLAYHIKRGAVGEECCAWLNRCHRNINADGADDLEIITWKWGINAAGENVSNPNGCWHYENDNIAARLTSRAHLCGDSEQADCGMRNQEGDFMGKIEGIGNQCMQRPNGHVHCTTSSSLSGIAHEYVTEFAHNQSAWFDAFLGAWNIAVTNGHGSLQALQLTC